jgi:CHAT domain-containing protein
MDVIHNLLPPSMFLGTAAMPTSAGVQTIIQNLPQASVFHLACHAQQDPNDPLDSGFDLVDGRLTLGQLMKLDLPRAQLAYLSSCQSAAVDENHPDEALNLAAVMLFMGFKSVVATMWLVVTCALVIWR